MSINTQPLDLSPVYRSTSTSSLKKNFLERKLFGARSFLIGKKKLRSCRGVFCAKEKWLD